MRNRKRIAPGRRTAKTKSRSGFNSQNCLRKSHHLTPVLLHDIVQVGNRAATAISTQFSGRLSSVMTLGYDGLPFTLARNRRRGESIDCGLLWTWPAPFLLRRLFNRWTAYAEGVGARDLAITVYDPERSSVLPELMRIVWSSLNAALKLMSPLRAACEFAGVRIRFGTAASNIPG